MVSSTTLPTLLSSTSTLSMLLDTFKQERLPEDSLCALPMDLWQPSWTREIMLTFTTRDPVL